MSWTWGCQRWCASEQYLRSGPQVCPEQGPTPTCTLLSFQEEGNCSSAGTLAVPDCIRSSYQEPAYLPNSNNFPKIQMSFLLEVDSLHYCSIARCDRKKVGKSCIPISATVHYQIRLDVIQDHCLRMSDYMKMTAIFLSLLRKASHCHHHLGYSLGKTLVE